MGRKQRMTHWCQFIPGVVVATRPVLLGLCLIWSAVGCGGPAGAGRSDAARRRGDEPIHAIATVGMVADLVRHVGGDQVIVESLMGPGVDPHLYKATRDDVQRIMRADLVFYCGLMLEGKMADTLARIGRRQPAVAVAGRLDPGLLLHPAGGDRHPDPHIWMDVSLWSRCIDVVLAELERFDPARRDDYRRRAAAYRRKLAALHEYGRRSIATIPPERRVLITSHDAFRYFGRAYGLQVEGIQGISTESEAGLRRINELVDLIVARKIEAVFVESSVPRKNIEAMVEGARSRGHEVRIGGELFSDAMGPAGTYEGTYIGMLDHNITIVTRALGGDAPEGGLHGRLTYHRQRSARR